MSDLHVTVKDPESVRAVVGGREALRATFEDSSGPTTILQQTVPVRVQIASPQEIVRVKITETGPAGPEGPRGPAGPAGDSALAVSYTHFQLVPATLWVIEHDLDFEPSVTVTDSAGSFVQGDPTYVSPKLIHVEFAFRFSGRAVLS